MKSGSTHYPGQKATPGALGIILVLVMLAGNLSGQNVAPKITGQSALSTSQDTPLEILFEHLQVTDPDNVYPDDFSMIIETGANYSVSGQTVIPDAGYSGTLAVPVSVNDGEASSPPFGLSIDVTPAEPENIPPVITAHSELTVVQGGSITINFSDLTVDDPDDSYPEGFSMTLQPGSGYAIDGQSVTPDPAFVGTLIVPVTVNDGEDESESFSLSISVTPQEPTNVKPVITGQVPVNTEQGVPVTIEFSHLTVSDSDNTYPDDFTMTLTPGANYTVSGRTITPDQNVTGTLSVPVTVSDGEASSDPFNLTINVTASQPENVKPVITGQVTLTTEEGKQIRIRLEHLTVTDPDDAYPSGFTLAISNGPNYSVNGHNVKPDDGFTGQLTVPVTVNDGEDSSDPFNLLINVEPKKVVNVAPSIIGQTPLTMLNTETLTILFSHLFVTDPDDTYPEGFTLNVRPGNNYTVSGVSVTPPANFSGTLTVKVSVNDGKDESNIFDLKITVNPPVANIKPVITGQQELTTFVNTSLSLRLTHLIVNDPDDEYPVGFTMETLPGDNYTVAGNVVTPASGFSGSLSVRVRVHDGTEWSESFILTISVVEKDELRITGQDELIIAEDSTLMLDLSHVVVNDPSNAYPAGFQLVITPGDRYTFSGAAIIPQPNFSGTLEIPIQVKSNTAVSNTFKLIVLVTPFNDLPGFSEFNPGPIPYSPANGEIYISGEVIVEDPDHDQLVFAEVFIDPGVFATGKDILTAASTANIRSVFDPNTGTLVLLGVAPVAEYQSALRSVRYLFDNDTLPAVRARAIHFRLNDGEGFSAPYTKSISVTEAITLDIPNVFTPNDDRSNDTWAISRQSQADNTSVTIRVFDKRGNLVYESHSLDEAWDGRFRGENLPSDTYFYTIEVTSRGNPLTRKGVVTILR